MKVYRVMERPASSTSAIETRFVAERFRWLAFLLPVVWLLSQRLWLTALLVFLLTLAVGLALPHFGFANAYVILCNLAVGFIVGLESTGLIASGLEKRDWREIGVTAGDTVEDAELRWFSRHTLEMNPADHSSLAGAPV
ncbi:DUF2628 domain-containing protein [Notoacmeibacter sp. MSK16QG-6]|uniref:DUF2628 domain-containing protein n=1 Tax=Notoacmeibacter sp. MSK16QG-6 TaxID=2957982 RepID=UPI00209C9F1F|nr:DUF2628 domain-containing protein [Notoacmeibacter sp. MSK16QG-6]MCP1199087.1 DUF2628 domain-containing protein [Notoacmeibacter sp. MSK16QG-6]